ncbi:MAG: glycosyltransferase [Acidobacteria bacterium]|nr:glycosyltransferase [Acidobacteriota bacterium]
MENQLRIAFFPDSYLEVNGAAMTSQRLVEFAKRKDFPYLCIHAARKNETWQDGSVTYMTLKRSPLSFSLDEDLAYDPFFQRYSARIERQLEAFKPDVIHITGLNDLSIVGAYLGWKYQIPILGSWHTNVHEFAAHRLAKMLRFLPDPFVKKITGFAERKIMDGAVFYYKMPKVVLAPNQELVDALGSGTNRRAQIMSRGVDTELFSPSLRTVDDDVFRIGFVGRLRAEKNVRLLADIERELIARGKTNFKFLIVGEGSERGFLEGNMKHAELTGFLDGAKLSEAYANMDLFLFPSKTDAFGNVTQEAFASGVPAIVTDLGGPKFLIDPGKTGFVARDLSDFVEYTIQLMDDREKLAEMKSNARENAMSKSWDAVFESVFDGYRLAYELREKNFKQKR